MTGIQWLKLDKTNLMEIPEEMGKLLKLVKRYLKKIVRQHLLTYEKYFVIIIISLHELL